MQSNQTLARSSVAKTSVTRNISNFFLPLQDLLLVFFFECAQDWYLNSFAFALTMVFSLHFCPTELLSVLRSNISKTTNNTSNAGPLCRHKKRVLARYTAGGKKANWVCPRKTISSGECCFSYFHSKKSRKFPRMLGFLHYAASKKGGNIGVLHRTCCTFWRKITKKKIEGLQARGPACLNGTTTRGPARGQFQIGHNQLTHQPQTEKHEDKIRNPSYLAEEVEKGPDRRWRICAG